MKLEDILLDWEDYDNRKKKTQDANFFSCSEDWEIEYLIQKIRKLDPRIREGKIITAIGECCGSVDTPRPRKEFLACIVSNLNP